MEQWFHELKERREVGEIDDEQFEAEVKNLQFRDRQGQLWRIAASTGQWYYEEEGRWVRGEPPREPKGPPLVLRLAGGVCIVLIIAGILAVLRGGIPGLVTLIAGVSTTKTTTSTPTDTPTQTLTDTPSPTSTATAFTPLPQDTPTLTYTPTLTPPTGTPTPTPPTGTPTPTPPTGTLTPTPPTDTPMPTPPTDTPMPTPPTDTPTPTPTPVVTGKIAFPVFDPVRGTYDIFIANADGTGQKKIIKEEASQPCLNPEGTWIAYRSWCSDKRGLRVADTFGHYLWTITTDFEASRPSVSKGGIAYHRRQALYSTGHIYLFPGSEEPEVIRWGDQYQPLLGESPAWVSGARLVYKGCVRGACGLYLTRGVYKGTGITQLTCETSDTNPEVSSDGKMVAFMSWRHGNWEIYVMDLDTRKVKRLTENAANDGLPIWSPDGRTIAFASDRSGEWAIWAMNPDGSNQRMLFPLGGSLHGYVRDAPLLHERGGWEEERLSWSPP
jgi:hypothetical protein